MFDRGFLLSMLKYLNTGIRNQWENYRKEHFFENDPISVKENTSLPSQLLFFRSYGFWTIFTAYTLKRYMISIFMNRVFGLVLFLACMAGKAKSQQYEPKWESLNKRETPE